MIYVDSSVVLRIHGRGLSTSHGEATRQLLGRLTLVALVGPVLQRALQPFPSPVRTLDALHLATVFFSALVTKRFNWRPTTIA